MHRHNTMLLPDMAVISVCLLLAGFGLAAIYSVSLAKDGGWAGKQMLWALLSAGGAAVMLRCSLSDVRHYARWLMVAVIGALLAAFFFDARNGAHRWIGIGGWSVQPSEFGKWAALLVVCYYAARPHYKRRQTAFVMPVIYWLLAPLLLIILQRDFGSLILISLVSLAILFLSGLALLWVIGLFIALIGIGGWLTWMEPYRVQRMMSFIDPFSAENGYHQKHAIIAFSKGEWWGSGVGRSIEKWGYLPEAHNDFIIAIIAEENGLMGMLAVCALLAFLVGRAIKIGNTAEARGEIFGALYAFGVAAMLAVQSFINIGGNLALLPFKGFTLPLVSYGGSSFLATGLMVGVLLRVDYENRQDALQAKEPA